MENRTLMRRGWRGVWIGAVIGAIGAALLGRLFAGIDLATGGPGLSMLAGMAVGGLAGFIITAFMVADRPG